MSRNPSLLAVLLLLLLPAVTAATGGVQILGSTASNNVRLDGHPVPSGTTLVSPSIVATDESPALMHLRGGHNVLLAAGSQAVFERSATGGIRVAVEAGVMELSGPGSAVLRLASNEAYVLEDETIGEGAEVEMVAMCTPDEDQDDWVLIQVPATEVEAHLAAGDVRAGREFNDLGLDEDCDEEPAAVLFTTGGKIVAGLSGLAVLGLIDEDEASP